MKRIFESLLTISACLLVLSCTNEMGDTLNGNQAKTFNATIDLGAETRTAIQTADNTDYGKVFWLQNDYISINGSKAYSLSGGSTSTSFDIASGENIPSAPFAAYYPYGMHDGTNSPVIPEVQEYDENCPGKSAPMSAISTSTDLTFRNLGAILLLKNVVCDTRLKSITVEADQFLCGTFSVVDYAAVISSGKKSVTMAFDRQTGLDATGGKDFYIALPAGELTNLKIIFLDINNHTITMTRKSPLTLERSKIKTVDLSAKPLEMADADPAPQVYYDMRGNTYLTPPTDAGITVEAGEHVEVPIYNIPWSEGATLEFELTCLAGRPGFAFRIGGDEDSGDPYISSYVQNGPWIHLVRDDNTNDKQSLTKDKFSPTDTPIIQRIRVNQNGLYLYLENGTTHQVVRNWDLILGPDDSYVQAILNGGNGTTPIWIGNFKTPSKNSQFSVSFNYVQVTMPE